ncbi:hypothetical protein ACSVIJ_24225 [Pseudomonas sp. NCHU5208]|uniref:hypothetical protein n=1 Tax=unclassified Pseudomonas TaxID=196821 RepID=UPI003F9EA323
MARVIQPSKASERSRGQRAGLDLKRIIEVARTIEHTELSMQTVADALNVDRKALNYHVRDRQTLLNLVAIDAFDGNFSSEGISAAASWDEACRRFSHNFVESVVSLGSLAEHLWFGDSISDLTLAPSEALFEHFRIAGFHDEDSVRLVTMLAILCLGHARDILQAATEAGCTRPRSLKASLEGADPKAFKNLIRIAALGVDTYSREQLDFTVDIFIEGARGRLQGAR